MSQETINLHQDIIDQCLKGSSDAQFQLYKLYSKAMFNICVRMINDRDDAEDVLQDAFVSAFRNLSSYRGDASFGSWLKRIVVNKCLNFIKKYKTIMVPIEDERIDVIDEPEEYDEIGVSLNVERIKAAIAELPDGFRTVLTLYLLEGYDHKEIADVMRITESTSKSQYLRAKKKLRSILENKVNYG